MTIDSTQMARGAATSFCAAGIAGPLDYLKDMALMGQTPRLRNCLHGVGLVMINDIPAAMTAFTMNQYMKDWIKSRSETHSLTTSQKMACAGVAGGCAGVVIAPGTSIILNYRKNKAKIPMSRIARTIYRNHGLRGFWKGGSMVVQRESKYAASYLIVAKIMDQYLRFYIEDPTTSLRVSAFTTGTITGALTTPVDKLRVRRQEESFKGKTITPFKQQIKALGIRGLFKNFHYRSVSIGSFCFLMVEIMPMFGSDDTAREP